MVRDKALDWFADMIPFDNVGMLPTGWSTVDNGTGSPEPVLTDNQWRAMADNARGANDGRALVGDLYLDSGEFLGTVRGVVRNETGRIGTAISNGRRA
jgi:hypothetical protein